MIYLIDEALAACAATQELELKSLKEENTRHLKALRPDPGEEVAFLDLKGRAAIYSVTETKPLTLEFRKSIHAEAPKVQTHLYLCPPVDSALEQAVEQSTEIGFDHIHFVRAERVQYPKAKSIPFSRLRRVVQASCKQSGRMWAPSIHEEFLSFPEALKNTELALQICADESVARNSWGSLSGLALEDKKHVAIFIGPEGGWSEAERKTLHASAHIFSLGPHVLRVPTAVVSAYVLAWKEIS